MLIVKAIDELRRSYPLALLCRLAGFSVKTFCYQKKPAAGLDKYAAARQGILEIWKRHRSCCRYDRLTHPSRPRLASPWTARPCTG
ncbi:hypothetical protein MUN46_000435 [Mesosutterella sp. AGMB02718]|uniref:Transposase n=1 Tax=Mesosutterella faecium TaxID=2925194 RepID=A0ABT7IM36_9BURK|nr:hypothetical protein [Mesosutterella sp. AGMB02718]MDL2058431.1 hypothetical protein [Mesosutterella sp. AGMB02718]